WNGADRFLQLDDALINRRPLTSRLGESENEALRRCSPGRKAVEREKLRDVGIFLQLLINLLLIGAHLRRRRTFLRDENSPHETAVAGRQQCEGQVGKEKPKAKNAAEEDG